MTMMKSKIGEIKSKAAWQKEVDDFWEWVEKQNRYICNLHAKTNRREFKKPVDAFERYVKLLGLVEIPSPSYKGVF